MRYFSKILRLKIVKLSDKQSVSCKAFADAFAFLDVKYTQNITEQPGDNHRFS